MRKAMLLLRSARDRRSDGLVPLAVSSRTLLSSGLIRQYTRNRTRWLAVTGAGFGLIIVFACVYGRLTSPKGLKNGCYAGVVTEIEPSFSDGWSSLAPYAAQHDRIDVVVKPDYWNLVERGFTIYYASDTLDSPLTDDPLLGKPRHLRRPETGCRPRAAYADHDRRPGRGRCAEHAVGARLEFGEGTRL